MPPFVVGENTSLTNSENITIHESYKTIEDSRDNRWTPTITGNRCTFKTGIISSIVISGAYANFTEYSESGNTYFDGGIIASSQTRIYSRVPSTQSHIWDFVNRGSIYGTQVIMFVNKPTLDKCNYIVDKTKKDTNSILIDSKEEEGRTQRVNDPNIKFPWNQGIITGNNFLITGNNDGLIAGGCGVFNGNNSGVIIAGSAQKEVSYAGPYQDPDNGNSVMVEPNMEGMGIAIVGHTSTCDPNHEYSDSGWKTSPGFIKVSDYAVTPTEFRGNLKLAANCNIYDVEGKLIIQNEKKVN